MQFFLILMNMKMTTYLYFIFIFCGIIFQSSIKAEITQKDSIGQELAPTSDDEKVKRLLEKADLLSHNNLESAIKYAYEALHLVRDKALFNLEAICFQEIGELYLAKGDHKKSLLYFNKAIQRFTTEEFTKNISLIYNDIGTVYSRKGILDSALYYHQLALSQCINCTDSLGQIASLRSVGNVQYKKGQFNDALSNFHLALSLCDYVKNSNNEKSRLYNNLGILYSDWGEYQKALSFYKTALEMMDSVENKSESSRVLNNMGNIYWYQEKMDSALLFYQKSLHNRKEIGDTNGEAFVLNNLGMYYGSLEEYATSLNYFNQSLLLFEKLGNRRGIVLTMYNIGSVYALKKESEKAIKFFNQSLLISQEQGFYDYILSNLEELNLLYQNEQQWERAFYSLLLHNEIKDSIREVQNMEVIKEMELSFDQEKHQADLHILQSQMESEKVKKNRNRILIGGIILILILIITSMVLIIYNLRNNNSIEQDKLTPTLLRYQLNPQFINSSLSGIKELVSKNRIKESALFLSGFAKLMRTLIETSSSRAIILDKEIETLKHFLQLHQLRYEHDLSFDIDISSHIESEMLAVPPLIYFPMFVHVIDYHLNDGKVHAHIQINTKHNYLITDAVIQFVSHDLHETNHLDDLESTLSAIHHRVKFLNKSLKDKIKFQIDPIPKQESSNHQIQLHMEYPIKPF